MGEISLEANAVSRFIVSLSKSIQALCHGCMDFDDSIEMIGYININIDSGKTVDCVLNEKVRKSAANAMTCVSNSFHAKKEKAKQVKDGSCSPIPQIDYSSNQSQLRKRSYMDYTTSRGSSRKRQRYHAPHPSYYPDQQTSQDSSFHQQHTTSDVTFHEQSTASSSGVANPEHVKTETHDNDLSTSSENFLVKEEQIDLPVSDPQDGGDDADNSLQEPSSQTSLYSNNDKQSNDTVTESFKEEKQNNPGQFENDNVDPESSFNSALKEGPQNVHATDIQQAHCSQDDAAENDQFEVIEIGDDDEEMQGLFDQAGAQMRHHDLQHDQQMMAASAFHQWRANHNFLSSSGYLAHMERERKKHLARLYRLNRTCEQRERDRRLARMRQRRRRARLRDQPDQELENDIKQSDPRNT